MAYRERLFIQNAPRLVNYGLNAILISSTMVNKKYYLLEQWVMNGYALVRWPVYVLERWTASKIASNHNALMLCCHRPSEQIKKNII